MILTIDIGATNTRVAAAETTKKIDRYVMFKTPQTFEKGMASIMTAGKALANGKRVTHIASGAPGSIDAKNGALIHAPNLMQWNRKPLVATLTRAFRAHTYLQNDTAMVGLGEAVFGAGIGKTIVAYITISTGVNGVRIVNQHIDENAFGFEIGFQIISPLKRAKAITSTHGYWGNYISGNSMKHRYKTSPKNITSKRVWSDVEKNVAIGLHNALLFWSPHIVVLGGSMMKSPGISITHVQAEVRKIMKIFPFVPPIAKAQLGDIGGVLGALAFLRTVKN